MKRSKKLKRKLVTRIRDWENTTNAKSSDISRKHPNGFHKPGSSK